MRKFTFKSLLIAAALCLGTSAWAEETRTSVYSNNFETSSDFTMTGKTGETDGHAYTPGVSAANTFGSKILGGGAASGDKGFMSPQFSVNEADIVDIDFKFKMDACATPKSSGIYITTGKNTSGWLKGVSSVFSITATTTNLNGYWKTITVGGEDLTSLLNTTGTYECNALNRNTTGVIQLNLRLNFLLQKATYSLTRADGTVLVDNKTVDFESEASTIYGLFFSAGKSYGGVYIDDLNVYTVESDEVIATKDYKINYQYEGETIHSTTGNLAVGASVESETVITVDDVKYLSVNDAQTFEITAEGDNVWTVPVRKPYTATLSVTTKIGDETLEPVVSSLTETDDKVCSWSYAYSKYVEKDGEYYVADDVTSFVKTGTFTDGEQVSKTIVYTKEEGVAYFGEWEDKAVKTGGTFNNVAYDNFSNGRGYALQQSAEPIMSVTFSVAEEGIYSIEMPYYNNNDKSRGHSIQLDGVELEKKSINSNTGGTFTTKQFLAAGEHTMGVQITYSLTSAFDYLLVKKVADANTTTTISEAGCATFSSTYAVDFSESGLTAYTATVNDNKVVMTPIENGIVPKNTGVILKGAAGNHPGVFTTTDAVIENNDLVAATEEIPSLETETTEGEVTYTNYILNVVNETLGFYQAAGHKVAAGKAYLRVLAETVAEAKTLTIVWNDGETTGIEENYEFGTMNSDAATFDLSGRKVANPAKGLYIKNGKKFIVR